MKFGAMVATKIDDWQLLQYAEALGYDSGWVPDTQMLWSDCYATMALAAWHTSRIRLGTGVAVPGTRLAPVTAHSIASINRIAPGRVFLGIGTGHTAMRVMGHDPMPVKEFKAYLETVRALLDGEETDYTHDGKTRAIRFLHRELGFLDLEHRVPIYVAANGPKALEVAGAIGDGRVCAGAEPLGVIDRNLQRLRQGAEKAGRALPEDFHTATLTFACLMRPGEKVTDERVAEEVGAQVGATLHFWWEQARWMGHEEFIPDYCRDDWERYKRFIDSLDMPPEKLHQRVHLGHCTYLPAEERQFITPATVQATGGLVGEPDQIRERIKAMEQAGCREIVLLPPKAVARSNFKSFSEEIMARL